VKSGKTAVSERTGNLRGRAIVEGGQGTAKKSVQLLSAILSFGISEGVTATNPSKGFKLPKDRQREVDDPTTLLSAFGRALVLAEQVGEPWQATNALRLLALTGLRHSEAVNLTWAEVDFAGILTRRGTKRIGSLRLSDSKTGPSVRPLNDQARRLLSQIHSWQRLVPIDRRPPGDCVFWAQRRGAGSYGGLAGAVRRIARVEQLSRADQLTLADFSPHHLRHAFATIADGLGMTEATIAALLGHRKGTVTSRYIGRVDEVLFDAANEVANEIHRLLTPDPRPLDEPSDNGAVVYRHSPEMEKDT
jgi:integrase